MALQVLGAKNFNLGANRHRRQNSGGEMSQFTCRIYKITLTFSVCNIFRPKSPKSCQNYQSGPQKCKWQRHLAFSKLINSILQLRIFPIEWKKVQARQTSQTSRFQSRRKDNPHQNQGLCINYPFRTIKIHSPTLGIQKNFDTKQYYTKYQFNIVIRHTDICALYADDTYVFASHKLALRIIKII